MFISKRFSQKYIAIICATALGLATPVVALDLRANDAPAKCGSQKLQIQATIHGVSPKGILTVELYRPSKNAFLKKSSRENRARVAARSGSQTICFNVKAPGKYALAAYHDVNGNRKLDRKINLLPNEPFALSNRQKLKLQMPKFQDAAFNVPASGAKVDLYLETR